MLSTNPITASQGLMSKLERRVVAAAQAALAQQRFVCPLDVLTGIGWLPAGRVTDWQRGRVEHLEAVAAVPPQRLATALATFHRFTQSAPRTPNAPTAPTGRHPSCPNPSGNGSPRGTAAHPTWSSSGRWTPSPAPAAAIPTQTCSPWTTPDRCAWPAPTSTTSSSCPLATPHSLAAPTRPAACPPWSCASAAAVNATNGRVFWSRTAPSNRPSGSACPTKPPGPGAASVTASAAPADVDENVDWGEVAPVGSGRHRLVGQLRLSTRRR